MTGPFLHRLSRWKLVLAAVASATAVSMSVLSGWQRGGWYPERCMGGDRCVLVISAHLLPALCRGAPIAVRCIGAVLCGPPAWRQPVLVTQPSSCSRSSMPGRTGRHRSCRSLPQFPQRQVAV